MQNLAFATEFDALEDRACIKGAGLSLHCKRGERAIHVALSVSLFFLRAQRVLGHRTWEGARAGTDHENWIHNNSKSKEV
jgi:hypothetical protein